MSDPNTSSSKLNWLRRRGRSWVTVGTGLFFISTLFPVVASLVPADQLPTRMGWLDVATAFTLVSMAILTNRVSSQTIDQVVIHASYRAYRMTASLPLILLILFFVFGDQIRWSVLLPGLAWRIWLFWYVLPAGLAAWSKR
jgi:hypothetical protein